MRYGGVPPVGPALFRSFPALVGRIPHRPDAGPGWAAAAGGSFALIDCPACTHAWQAAESDLGLRQCSVCGADLEITRVPIAWSYDATEVAVVKADEAS